MTELQAREKIVATAKNFLGRRESNGSHKEIIDIYNAHTPRARGYFMKYTDAWCACFVSVVSIKAGFTDIMPTECSCAKMIELYQRLGRWEENDAYRPMLGDAIFYDWQDSGNGDNTGAPDHVGIVVSVTGSTIKVIEGNKNDAVEYRTLAVNGRYIRGYGLPDYAKKAAETAVTPTGQAAASGTASNTPTASAPVVGGVVQFTGAVHYTSANAGTGKTCKPGAAKVTQTAKGAKHPYHLIAQNGGGSNVYGWVDAADIQAAGGAEAPKMRVGAKVQYSGPV